MTLGAIKMFNDKLIYEAPGNLDQAEAVEEAIKARCRQFKHKGSIYLIHIDWDKIADVTPTRKESVD